MTYDFFDQQICHTVGLLIWHRKHFSSFGVVASYDQDVFVPLIGSSRAQNVKENVFHGEVYQILQ